MLFFTLMRSVYFLEFAALPFSFKNNKKPEEIFCLKSFAANKDETRERVFLQANGRRRSVY